MTVAAVKRVLASLIAPFMFAGLHKQPSPLLTLGGQRRSCFTHIFMLHKIIHVTREVTIYTKELSAMTKNNLWGTFCSFFLVM